MTFSKFFFVFTERHLYSTHSFSVDEIHATEKKFKKLSPKDLFIHNQEMETLQEENKPKSLVSFYVNPTPKIARGSCSNNVVISVS